MKLVLMTLIFMIMSLNVFAIGVDKDRLQDPAQEAKAQQLMKKLRCLVCQNQSIVDSDASLAEDLRSIVREQVKAGKSEKEIIDFMTSRYGDWVLLKPPVRATTALLWFGPAILLIVGGFLVFRFVRRTPKAAMPKPLSPEEEKRLKHILKDKNI